MDKNSPIIFLVAAGIVAETFSHHEGHVVSKEHPHQESPATYWYGKSNSSFGATTSSAVVFPSLNSNLKVKL